MSKQLTAQDTRILKGLIRSRAEIASQKLSKSIRISQHASQLQEKLAEEYLVITYSSILEGYGWRQVEILLSTGGGKGLEIGRELLKREEVAYVARSVGEFTIDLRAEVFVRSGAELVKLIEYVKGMSGVKDLIWSEIVEIVSRKNHLSRKTLAMLAEKKAIRALA